MTNDTISLQMYTETDYGENIILFVTQIASIS